MEKVNIDCDYYMEHNSDLKSLCARMAPADRNKFLISHYERCGYKENRKVRFITDKCEQPRRHRSRSKDSDETIDESDLKLLDKLKRNFRKSIRK